MKYKLIINSKNIIVIIITNILKYFLIICSAVFLNKKIRHPTNIGTTVTAFMLLAFGFGKFSISDYSLPFIGIGIPLYFTSKNIIEMVNVLVYLKKEIF